MNEIINVQLVDFKITSANELVRHNSDDSYTILLNSRQAENVQKRAYLHAMQHIKNGDCDNCSGSVQEIEYRAHNL